MNIFFYLYKLCFLTVWQLRGAACQLGKNYSIYSPVFYSTLHIQKQSSITTVRDLVVCLYLCEWKTAPEVITLVFICSIFIVGIHGSSLSSLYCFNIWICAITWTNYLQWFILFYWFSNRKHNIWKHLRLNRASGFAIKRFQFFVHNGNMGGYKICKCITCYKMWPCM